MTLDRPIPPSSGAGSRPIYILIIYDTMIAVQEARAARHRGPRGPQSESRAHWSHLAKRSGERRFAMT